MENNTYKFYLIAFFAILALPLLALPPWLHPAAWGKVVLFRIIISILIFVFLWQVVYKKISLNNLKFLLNKKNKVFLPFWLLIALWGTFLLATIFSLDPYYSFWESPYRAGGFLNFSLYIIFAVLTFLIIKGKDWLKLWKFSLIIGVLVSLVAVMQYFKVFSQHLIPYEGRPPSTFGNTIFLGIYLLFSVFMGLNLFLKEKQKVKKILYLLALLLFLFVILITGSRAVYFGLLIGFTYFILFFPKKQRLVVLLKILFILLLIVGVYGVYYLNTAPKLPD